jgi:hypothetical protein
VLEQIMGLPTHVLLVHAAVVLVPLFAAAAAVYAVLPSWRQRLNWVVAALAVVAPLAALFTKLSGDSFFRALQNFDPPRASGQLLTKIQEHQDFGTVTAWLTGALGVVALLMLYVAERSWPSWLPSGPGARRGIMLGFTVVVIGLALATGYYIFMTGDSGARMQWESILQD